MNVNEPPTSQAGRKGGLKRLLGWLTGDRRVEAEGAAEARADHPTEDQVEQTERDLKREYGETDRPPGR